MPDNPRPEADLQKNTDTPQRTENHDPAPRRRQLLKGGIAVTPVILTLTSRPAVAGFCSPSAYGSMNMSKGPDLCGGLTHGYWKTHYLDWQCYDPGSPQCEEDEGSGSKGKGGGAAPCQEWTGGTKWEDVFDDCPTANIDPEMSLMQLMWDGEPPGDLCNFGKHAVAALLSSCADIGYTPFAPPGQPGDVIEFVNHVCNGEFDMIAPIDSICTAADFLEQTLDADMDT